MKKVLDFIYAFVVACILGGLISCFICAVLADFGAGHYCVYCKKGVVMQSWSIAAKRLGSTPCKASPDSLHDIRWCFQSPDTVNHLKYIKQ